MLVFFVAHAQRFWGLRMTHLHSSPTNLHLTSLPCVNRKFALLGDARVAFSWSIFQHPISFQQIY